MNVSYQSKLEVGLVGVMWAGPELGVPWQIVIGVGWGAIVIEGNHP